MDLSILSDLKITKEGRTAFVFELADNSNSSSNNNLQESIGATSKQTSIAAAQPRLKLVQYVTKDASPGGAAGKEEWSPYVTCNVTDRKNVAGQFLCTSGREGAVGTSSGSFLKQYHPKTLKWRTLLHCQPSLTCKKVIEGYPFLNPIVHFRYKRLSSKAFAPFEPLFCNLAIYSVSGSDIVRVSETFRFDLTSAKIKSLYEFTETGKAAKTGISGDNATANNAPATSSASRAAGSCIFPLPSGAGTYLVLQVEKYLTDDPDTATLPYSKYLYPEQGPLLKKVRRLHNYRQPLGIAMMKLPSEAELAAPSEEQIAFAPSTFSLHVMSQKSTLSDSKLAAYIRENFASEGRGGAEKLDLEIQLDLRLLREKDVSVERREAGSGDENKHIIDSAHFRDPTIPFLAVFSSGKLYQSVLLRESERSLYVYIKSLDRFKERNLSVKVQLVEFSQPIPSMSAGGDKPLPFSTKGFQILKRLYSVTGDGCMMSNRYSTVSYHTRNPSLNDEFKVRLPATISDRMALRLTVRHVHVREMKATISTVSDILFASEESKPRYVEVGVAILPLLTGRATPLRDGDHTLRVALPEAPLGKQQQQGAEQETPLLLLGTRMLQYGAAACVWTEELLQLAELSSQALVEIGSDDDVSSAVLRVLGGYIDNAAESCTQKHFFRLLDVLLILMTSGSEPSCVYSAVRAASFNALVAAFYKACGYLTISPSLRAGDADFARDGQLLQGFVEYIYSRGHAGDGRAAAHAHEVLVYYWSLALGGSTINSTRAGLGGGCSADAASPSLVVLAEIAPYLLKIIFKSLAFKVSRENISDSAKIVLDDQYSALMVTFLEDTAAQVAQMTDTGRRRLLNSAVVCFIQSLLSLVIPMQVSLFLDVYLSSFDSLKTWTTSSERVQLKLEIWDMVTSFDKFVPLNFIPSGFDRHWLARKLIVDVVSANASASPRLRDSAAHIVRELLCRQEYDPLYSSPVIKRELADMYAPLVREVVLSAETLAAMTVDAPLRRDLLAILAYLVDALPAVTLRDEICALKNANLQSNFILSLHLMLDTFEMSSVYLFDTEIDVFAAEHLRILAPKFVVQETQQSAAPGERLLSSPEPSQVSSQRRAGSMTGESSSAGIGGILKAMVGRRPTSERGGSIYTSDKRQSWAAHEPTNSPLTVVQRLVIDIECIHGAVRGVADGVVSTALRAISVMLDGNAASDKCQLNFLLSVILHGLTSSLCKENISSLYKTAALVVHKFGVRAFFDAVDDSLQDWMRVILRSNVSSVDACHFLFTLFEFCYRSYGSLSHPRRALLGVIEDVIWSTIEEADYDLWIKNCADETLALEPLTTFVLFGAEEIANKLSQLARAPAAMRASQDMANLRTFLLACRGLFEDMQLLLECQELSRKHLRVPILFDFGGSNQLDPSPSADSDTTSAGILATASARRRELQRASANLSNKEGTDLEYVVERFLDASKIFDPLQLPRFASRYMELACRLQEINGNLVEAGMLRLSMAQLFDRIGPPSLPLCSALWMPRAPIDWRRRGLVDKKRAPSWLDTPGPSPIYREGLYYSPAIYSVGGKAAAAGRSFYAAYLLANRSPRSPWRDDKQYSRHIESLLSIAAPCLSAASLIHHAELCTQLYLDRLRRQGRVVEMASCYRQIATAFASTAENTSPGVSTTYCLGIFYRALFYGDAAIVPPHLRNQEFVVRCAERLNIGQFQDSLIASIKPLLPPKAIITVISASKEAPLGADSETGGNTMFISLTSVKAHFDTPFIGGGGDPSKSTSTCNFSYALPLTLEGKVYAKAIDQQWKRVVNITTAPFPGHMLRQRVRVSRTLFCSPIECGIDNIDEQIVELQLEVEKDYDTVFAGLDRFRQSISNLMRLVQGTMLPQVNGGLRDILARFLAADSYSNFSAAVNPHISIKSNLNGGPVSDVSADVLRAALTNFAGHQARLRSRLERCLELCESLLAKSSRMLNFNFEATGAPHADVADLKQQISPFFSLASLATSELKFFRDKLNAR